MIINGIDCIEYDVTIQISAIQHGDVLVCMGVCEHVPYKSNQECGVLRALLMYAFGHAYGLPYKMVTCIATKGLFNTVYSMSKQHFAASHSCLQATL